MSKVIPVAEPTDAPAQLPPGQAQGTQPEYLPDKLPFRFRLDVPCVWLGAKKGKYSRLTDEDIALIPRYVEREWRRMRQRQEIAWARKGDIGYHVKKAAADDEGDHMNKGDLSDAYKRMRHAAHFRERSTSSKSWDARHHSRMTAVATVHIAGQTHWLRV
jgi:hypothetical protein